MIVGGVAWQFPAWFWGTMVGALTLCGVGWGLVLWRAGVIRAQRGHLKGQGTILEQQREAAQERLAALDDRFEALGLSPSAVQVARMQKNLERARRQNERLYAIEGALEALASQPPASAAAAGAAAAAAAAAAGAELPANLLPLEELPEAEARLEALETTISGHETELLRLMEEETALQGELLAAEALAEEVQQLRAQEAELCHRRDVLALSIDLLGGAVDEYHQVHFTRFGDELGQSLRLLTGGRYAEVRCDEHFAFALRSKGNSWQPLERFSHGTVDACRLAVRLALTRRLARDRHLPLILDDPLVNLDRGRMGEALKMLERLSREHQIILFSHDEQLLKRAARDRWHVIPLEESRGLPPHSIQERNDDSGQLHLL